MQKSKERFKKENEKSLKRQIKNLLAKYNLEPKKYFGQNFLIEKRILNKILDAAELEKKDIVLEVGPGFGVLTKELAKKVKKVIAIEKDKNLTRALKKELVKEKVKNVKIVEGDVLKIKTGDLNLPTKYKVVANIPYYITSPIIKKFLEEKGPPASVRDLTSNPKLMVLMVQKEVAKRICAKPPNMNLLAVATQFYATPKIIKIVKKDCFWPKPKIDSAILKIENINSQKHSFQFKNQFFKVVKTGFSCPRKQLKNNLNNVFGKNTKKILEKTKIDIDRRAETLSIKEWILLASLTTPTKVIK